MKKILILLSLLVLALFVVSCAPKEGAEGEEGALAGQAVKIKPKEKLVLQQTIPKKVKDLPVIEKSGIVPKTITCPKNIWVESNNFGFNSGNYESKKEESSTKLIWEGEKVMVFSFYSVQCGADYYGNDVTCWYAEEFLTNPNSYDYGIEDYSIRTYCPNSKKISEDTCECG